MRTSTSAAARRGIAAPRRRRAPGDTPSCLGSRSVARWRGPLVLTLLGAALAATVLGSVAVGSVGIHAADVAAIALERLGLAAPERTWTEAEANIVWLLRVPRVLTGIAVGAALAVAGACIQALVRNALADPYLLGISSGASAGAAAHILFGLGAVTGAAGLAGSAFLGAVCAIVLVGLVARAGGRLVTSRLVFAGIAVGFALGALTNLLVFLSDSRDGVRAVLFWMLGSLGQSRWDALAAVWCGTLAATTLLWLWARRFDAIALGDDTARALGTDPTRFRASAVAIVALLVALAVSVSGAIGFVGLVVPHLARRLVGGAHRWLVPASALLGGLVLVWADTLARSIVPPAELPLGILTALLGAPLLIALVHRRSVRHGEAS